MCLHEGHSALDTCVNITVVTYVKLHSAAMFKNLRSMQVTWTTSTKGSTRVFVKTDPKCNVALYCATHFGSKSYFSFISDKMRVGKMLASTLMYFQVI